MKNTKIFIAILAATFFTSIGQTKAGLIIEIKNLAYSHPATFGNASTTFSGTGYVGLRPVSSAEDPHFANHLAMEIFNGSSHTRTALQVDISSLGNVQVQSATLSFLLGSSQGSGTASATITSFETTGSLGYVYDISQQTIGSISGSVEGVSGNLVSNSFDVTSLLQERVDAGANWLGLHLAAFGGNSTLFFATTPNGNDTAEMRLAIEFAAIPEPSSILLVTSFVTLASIRRIRRK